jgi:N6-adenosine-specific RNA methylase IME4
MSKYRTIVADPPWSFGSAATKADARKHYATMPLDDICALPVADSAEDDAHLWLWILNGMVEEARLSHS